MLSLGDLMYFVGAKKKEEIIDDCRCCKLIGSHTFVVLGDPGDPDMLLQYRIDGETLTFDAVMPDQCS